MDAVKSGWLKELDSHPPFRSMLEHKAFPERLAHEGVVGIQLCFVSMFPFDSHVQLDRTCRKASLCEGILTDNHDI